MLRRVTAAAGLRRRGRAADPADPCELDADAAPSPFLALESQARNQSHAESR